MDFSPLEWSEFFDRKEILHIGDDRFNVYMKGSSGPLFFLLHGGGYTGLTWAPLVEKLSSNLECQFLAPDLRGHGETEVVDSTDMSTECQIRDICNIYQETFANREGKPPPIILIGHSMGGALAIRTVHSGKLPNILVVSAIDVVEGSAMASLGMMRQFLRNRPQQFRTVQRAIEWCVKSRTTSNLRAARVSMPSRLVQIGDNDENVLRWRTNLSETEPHWQGWFKGLSKLFLQCDPVKIIILANVDRLDKELLTGQMRGQFQMEVLPKVGHAVHEDSPELVSQIFVQIVNRYKVIFQKYL